MIRKNKKALVAAAPPEGFSLAKFAAVLDRHNLEWADDVTEEKWRELMIEAYGEEGELE